MVGRRAFALGALAFIARSRSARAGDLISIPIAISVVSAPGDAGTGPVATSAWVDEQLQTATSFYAEQGIRLEEKGPRRTLPEKHAGVVTKADRDAFGAYWDPRAIQVFVVRSLMDVDTPGLVRRGVTWRNLRDLSKKYIVLSSISMPMVLAHELGHYFGNGHSTVKNNLMSYDHEPGVKPFFDATQASRSREIAKELKAAFASAKAP